MKAWKEEWKRVRLEIPARVRFDYLSWKVWRPWKDFKEESDAIRCTL